MARIFSILKVHLFQEQSGSFQVDAAHKTPNIHGFLCFFKERGFSDKYFCTMLLFSVENCVAIFESVFYYDMLSEEVLSSDIFDISFCIKVFGICKGDNEKILDPEINGSPENLIWFVPPNS